MAIPTMAQTSASVDIDALRWKNRILMVFNPHHSQVEFSRLAGEIDSSRAEFDDRDMLLVVVKEYISLTPDSLAHDNKTIQGPKANDLRRRFAVAEDRFMVLVIGKDGGVKLRADTAPALEDIFGLIDTMPMRQREMGRRPDPE